MLQQTALDRSVPRHVLEATLCLEVTQYILSVLFRLNVKIDISQRQDLHKTRLTCVGTYLMKF